MYSTPTTTISVLRGTTTDAYGDEIDTDDPFIQGEPASLIEKSRRVTDPVTGVSRVITYFICRVKPTLQVQDSDRILDEADNAIYSIDSIKKPKGPFLIADMRIDLTQVN